MSLERLFTNAGVKLERTGSPLSRGERGRLLAFFANLPPCVVAMEACAGAHYWGRELARLGHTIRLIPPIYVKPFVKWQKNDMADAEAICEAAQRPTMRFVAPKSAEAQGSAVVFRTRDLLVRQRTQLINALRGHLAEFGFVVRQGAAHSAKLMQVVENPGADLPAQARPVSASHLQATDLPTRRRHCERPLTETLG